MHAAGGNCLASVLPRVTSTMTSADSLRQVLLRSSHSVRKASQGKSTIFPVIYPPHLHREFRIAWGFSLCCNLTHSHMPDAVPVRRTNGLPRASFRFHLTMDTLAFSYALGAIPCARDFHPLDCAHAWHTTTGPPLFGTALLLVFYGLLGLVGFRQEECDDLRPVKNTRVDDDVMSAASVNGFP